MRFQRRRFQMTHQCSVKTKKGKKDWKNIIAILLYAVVMMVFVWNLTGIALPLIPPEMAFFADVLNIFRWFIVVIQALVVMLTVAVYWNVEVPYLLQDACDAASKMKMVVKCTKCDEEMIVPHKPLAMGDDYLWKHNDSCIYDECVVICPIFIEKSEEPSWIEKKLTI